MRKFLVVFSIVCVIIILNACSKNNNYSSNSSNLIDSVKLSKTSNDNNLSSKTINQNSASNYNSQSNQKSNTNQSSLNSLSKESNLTSNKSSASTDISNNKIINKTFSSSDTLVAYNANDFSKTNGINLNFNRFNFSYSASNAIKGIIHYKVGANTLNETFYLEKGANLSFGSLIGGYLNGDSGSEIIKMEFQPLVSGVTTFKLENFKEEKIAVVSNEIYYFENEKYKVGIKLSWGGGISYILDKNDGDLSLNNLINNADTGRLVQQSYYGINTLPYECGTYNGDAWRYNPVQGGNIFNEKSKLVDFKIDENNKTIYVKCQPRDWAKNEVYTPSYMENVYKLEPNYINVDNRFIDFSNYLHNAAEQELPAFYTLSYFKNFTYYAGNNAWNNDELTTKNDLPFWGDNSTHNSCLFNIPSTESWCAWTSDNNYGIGIYVPNISTMLAGRHAFNNSKDASNVATNYVAPIRTITLKAFEPINYSYIISTGNLTDMRELFSSLKNFADNSSLGANYANQNYLTLNFNSENSIDFIKNTNACSVNYDSVENAAKFTYTASDSYFSINYASAINKINANNKKKVIITYKCSKNVSGELFYCLGSVMNPLGNLSKRFTYNATSSYKTVELDFSAVSSWKDNINSLRFDFDIDASTPIYIKSIEIC